VWAADKTGSGNISGYVRSSAGVPQMGAMVEVLSSALHTFRMFTDENGFYSARNVVPVPTPLKPPFRLIFQLRASTFPYALAAALSST